MFWLIATRELREHLTSFRFGAVFVLTQTLMLTSVLVFAIEYRTAQEEYPDRVRSLVDAEGLTNLRSVACNSDFTVAQVPARLAFASGTGERELPNRASFALHGLNEVSRAGGVAAIIASGVQVDWTYVIAVLLSFAAGVLTYRSVAGELEDGTLALALANPVSRAAVLLGKYAAAVVAVAVSVAVGMVLGLLVLELQGVLELRGDDALKLILVALLALAYLSCFVLIGLLCSVLSRNATIAAVAFLFAWATLVFVVPNVAGIAAPRLSGAPTPQQIRDRAESVEDRIPVTPGMDRYEVSRTRVDQELAAEQVVLEYVQELDQQVQVAQNLARLSPTSAFAFAAEEAIGGGLGRFRRFVANAVRFRQQAFEAVLDADRDDPESEHRYHPWMCGGSHFSSRKVDLGSAARFRDPPPSSADSLATARPDLVLLVIYNAILILLTFARFMRQDITPGAAG